MLWVRAISRLTNTPALIWFLCVSLPIALGIFCRFFIQNPSLCRPPKHSCQPSRCQHPNISFCGLVVPLGRSHFFFVGLVWGFKKVRWVRWGRLSRRGRRAFLIVFLLSDFWGVSFGLIEWGNGFGERCAVIAWRGSKKQRSGSDSVDNWSLRSNSGSETRLLRSGIVFQKAIVTPPSCSPRGKDRRSYLDLRWRSIFFLFIVHFVNCFRHIAEYEVAVGVICLYILN